MNNPAIDGPDLLSLGMSMIVVVAAVLLIGWLYSRFRFPGGVSGSLINVVSSRALGPKERLVLVEVADQHLLVGITATSVQTLHTFDKPVTAASVPAEDATQPTGFADRLRLAIRGAAK